MSTPQPDPAQPPRAGQTTFGELLRRYRLAAGLSQEALAERAGLSVQGLSLLENGKRQAPYRSTIALLARALGLSPAQAATLEARVVRSRRPAGAGIVPFPELSTAPAPWTNLPLQLTRFIGREWAMAEVLSRLSTTRLLTLTGTGGVGKTRLALRVGAALLDSYAQGVWLVELAPLADPALVPGAVLEVLGVPEQAGCAPLDTLRDVLRTRQLLLLLDNCEHQRDACVRLSEALLQTCMRLQILATSREPLGAAGEALWRVPSLSLPLTDQPASPESVAQCEAGQLFVDRARAVQPSFVLTAATAAAVAGVCARLDGIPLALELAASRLSGLGVVELAARLDQRFRLLTGGSSTTLPRQQTLQATVDWSYSLLTPQEQTLFLRLCIFAGGWSLEAAEAVGAGRTIAPEEVLDLLAHLVDKSLVMAEEVPADGSTWYRLLETLRQYGWERLLAGGEMALVQRRHTAYYVALAECADRGLTGPEQQHWLERLEREHTNLRVALAWCLGEDRPELADEPARPGETGLRLAGALFWFWFYRDHHPEGLTWLERALARGTAASAAGRARALFSAGVLATDVNDLAHSQALLAQSVALSREIGDTRQYVLALGALGLSLCHNAQDEQAAAVLVESLALARTVGEPWLIGYALLHVVLRVAESAAIARAEERARAWAAGVEGLQCFEVAGDRMCVATVQLLLGQIALYEGDYEWARTAFGASLPLLRALGWRSTVADIVVKLADVARKQGDFGEATARYTEALTLYRQVGSHLSSYIAWVLSRQAEMAFEQGDWMAAQTHLAESLTIARAMVHEGTPQLAGALLEVAAVATVVPSVLEVGAALAAVQDEPRRSLRLAGAAAALRAQLNRQLAAAEQATLEQRLASARQALTAAEQATAWAEGQALTREQAIAAAFEGFLSAHGTPLGSE